MWEVSWGCVLHWSLRATVTEYAESKGRFNWGCWHGQVIVQNNWLKKLVTAWSSVTCVTLTVLLVSLDMAVAFLCSSLGSLPLYDRKRGRSLSCKTRRAFQTHTSAAELRGVALGTCVPSRRAASRQLLRVSGSGLLFVLLCGRLLWGTKLNNVSY